MTPEQVQLLALWNAATGDAAAAKAVIEKEQSLRKQVTSSFFPGPKEGTNTVELEAGWKLKLTYKLDRKLDEASLPAIKEQLREMNINPDTLVEMKPFLNTKGYKTLHTITPEAGKIFDQALVIKPASPTLELIPPKEKT